MYDRLGLDFVMGGRGRTSEKLLILIILSLIHKWIMSRQKCAVCSNPTILFSYGVQSCNACTLFFRRAVSGKYPIMKCQNGQICQLLGLHCRFCRFQQCVQAGMSQISNSKLQIQKYQSLSNVINNLIYLDNHRRHQCLEYCISDDVDYTVEEILMGAVNLPKRSKDQMLSLSNWGFMCGFTTMEFMRKFEFVEKLEKSDLQIFLRKGQFAIGVFSNAMSSFARKTEKMTFPDGSEPIPIVAEPIFSEDFLNRIRYRLVIRMMELKVTKEEFLLLTAVLVCNPVIPNLSDAAQNLLSSYQKTYTSYLFQYSLITYQGHGPSRFSDLLSLCGVINATLSDFYSHFQLLKLHFPKWKVRAIVEDCLTNNCAGGF